METVGSLVDKLITVDMKMWNAMERFYGIRRMNFQEFRKKFSSANGMKRLWRLFVKSADLNVQRNDLIDEIDARVVSIVLNPNEDSNVQRKHKTYRLKRAKRK